MEINRIQAPSQSQQSETKRKACEDQEKLLLFGYGFRSEDDKVDKHDFSKKFQEEKPLVVSAWSWGLGDSSIKNCAYGILRNMIDSSDDVKVSEKYDEEKGIRTYTRKNIKDGTTTIIITNENNGIQQEISIDKHGIATVKNYKIDHDGHAKEYDGFVIANKETSEIYTLDELESKIKNDPNFDLEAFLDGTGLIYDVIDAENGKEIHIYENGKNKNPSILKYENENLTYNK